MKWSSYPDYAESAIDALGQIPSHWHLCRIAIIASKITNGYVGPTRDILVNEGVTYLQSLHIKNNTIRFDDKYFVTEEWSREHAKSILKTGDVLVVQTGDIGQAAHVPPEFENCNCHALIVITTKDNYIGGKYLSWVLNSNYGYHSLKRIQTGALHPHLNCTLVRDIFVPIPPLSEQELIMDFVGEEAVRIQNLIGKKQRLIELLNEKRAAIISHAVTKGLDPSVPMKDSGIEWLGEIPEHWEVLRVKRLSSRIQTGSTPPTSQPEYYEDGDIPWFGPGSFSDDLHLSTPVKTINSSSIRDGVARLFASGCVMIVTIGATIGKVGYLSFAASSNQQITAVQFKHSSIFPRYAAFQLKSFEAVFRGMAPNTTLPILDQQEIGSFFIASPPLNEQIAIVSWIENAIYRLDAMRSRIRMSVDRLVEYRSALISAAVTGKIDVRNYAPTTTETEIQQMMVESG